MSNDLFWPPTTGESDDAATENLGTHVTSPLYPDASPQRQHNRWWRTPAAAAGAAALAFGAAGVGVGAALVGDNNSSTSSAGFTVAGSTPSSSLTDPKSYSAIAAKVLPSVVNINVTSQGGGDTGSGVILRSDGYILTNNHVISSAVSGGGSISVTFNDGTSTSASVVGADQEDDLAVIKVNKTGLPAATLGSSSKVRVGDPVLAVGSPLGLQGTVTSGIVSSINRPVDTTDQQQQINPFNGQPAQTPATAFEAIQTDAAINPGNSGGPLVDGSGNVIGINSAIASTGGSAIGGQAGNIGVGFAIPIDQAKPIAQELITTGKASHPLLGVSLAPATDNNGNAIARVAAVSPGGPAQKAGIKAGDIIVAIDGQQTAGSSAAIAAIRAHKPGDTVSVTVLRNGQRLTFHATLADASQS
jgi:putative serine protease PepD